MAPTYAQLVNDARKGSMTFREFLDWWNTTGSFQSSAQNVPEVESLLTILRATEANQGFMKGNQIQIINGQVAVFLQTTPAYPGQSIIGGAAEAAGNLPKIGLDLEKWATRIGEALAGLILIAVGINAVTRREGRTSGGLTRTARKVSRTATKLTPATRAVSRVTSNAGMGSSYTPRHAGYVGRHHAAE
jgi:hypothetical protein